MNETNERSGNGGVPSLDELERRGNAIRAGLDRTLEALEHKLSPREMATRSATYLRDHSLQLLGQAGDTMRRHPETLLLAAIGVAWMGTSIVRKRRGASSEHDSDYDGDMRSYAGREAAQRVWQHARKRAQTTAASLREQASDTFDSARDRLAETLGTRRSFAQEHPLMVGLLAAVAGALVGAALPVSEPE